MGGVGSAYVITSVSGLNTQLPYAVYENGYAQICTYSSGGKEEAYLLMETESLGSQTCVHTYVETDSWMGSWSSLLQIILQVNETTDSHNE